MSSKLEKALWHYDNPIISDSELEALLGGTKDSRHSIIKRALQNSNLIRIKRGLYCLGERLRQHEPHPFEIAQRLYGLSYISFESALSYHDLIPERVTIITSATIKRNKTFDTPFGTFEFNKLPNTSFFLAVDMIKLDQHQFLMASPWKAILDYLYCRKKKWNSIYELEGDLRIELDELPKIKKQQLDKLNDYYQNKNVSHFIHTIPGELIDDH